MIPVHPLALWLLARAFQHHVIRELRRDHGLSEDQLLALDKIELGRQLVQIASWRKPKFC